MNFISVAISIFISNFIIISVIRHLPIRRNQLWQLIIVTVYNLGGLLFEIIPYFTLDALTLTDLLYLVGNILGVGIGYTATLFIVLDRRLIFKSRRLKQFERDLKRNDDKSISRVVLAIACLCIASVLLVYGIVSALNYDKSLLISLIGVCIGITVSLGLSIYFFLTSGSQHKTIKASNLLFIVSLPNDQFLYHEVLNKEHNLEEVLKPLQDLYYIDELGLIVTPTERYIVKGIHLNTLNQEIYESIPLNRYYDTKLDKAIPHLQKYNRKKIQLDESNEVVKISRIK